MDDLISEFITETSESISMLDQELVKLEQNPEDTEILSNIFRLVHTIKGTCGFLGLPRLESVAHAGENVLGRVRDKEIPASPAAISLVLEALDAIRNIIEYLAANGKEPEGNDDSLRSRLNEFALSGGKSTAAAAPTPPPAPKIEPADPLNPTEAELQAIFDAAPGPGEAPKAFAQEPAKKEEAAASVPVAKELPKAIKEEAIQQGLKTDAKAGQDALANQSIRVNLDVLENLMRMVGELVLIRNQLLQISRTRDDSEFSSPLQQLSHITTELQEGVMKTRMQPIGNAWSKFPRLIRDLSMELNKKIELKMLGAETELDRQLLELIKDPLTHMVRNSCDHGLEGPEDRLAAGKPETGTVTLSAYHEGGHIIVDIIDDGRGISIERVKAKAIQNKLATEAEIEQMSEQQIMQFIFRAGFSTAEKVTSVSGRGVGMDVVRTNIEKIGGTVELQSKVGFGSTFHIKIPLTLAIVSVMIVESSKQRFAIPQINVVELVRTGKDAEYKVEIINGTPVLRLRETLLPMISLAKVLGMPETPFDHKKENRYVVVCRVGANDFGLIVDSIYDTEEIVVKPVSEKLSHINVYSGNTVLGDGSVIMILDPTGILRRIEGEALSAAAKGSLSTETTDELLAEDMVSFLLFSTGVGAPKAVALELVARLEELDASQVEYSNGRPVVQYREDLMLLTTTGDMPIPTEGAFEAIVFAYDGKSVGLVVKEVLDILSAPPRVQIGSKDDTYLGSLVMNGRTTDVLDVGKMLSRILNISAHVVGTLGNHSQDIRVLLVDDSMFFRNLTVPFLTEVGYKVMAVAGAEEALAAMKKHQFDVIVTDIEMPKIDGFELTRQIRRLPQGADLKIIGFTATFSDAIQERVVQSGMDTCIMKMEREKLILAIAHHNELETV
ncbi:MAG: chemotaxis protein CheW [Rickettsiales bacterium]